MKQIIFIVAGLWFWLSLWISGAKRTLFFNEHISFIDWLFLLNGMDVLGVLVFTGLSLWLGPILLKLLDRLNGIENQKKN